MTRATREKLLLLGVVGFSSMTAAAGLWIWDAVKP